MASTSLSRTPASAGNRQTWTVSFWIKRANLSTNQGIFSTYDGTASINTQLSFRTDDTLDFYDNDGSYQWNLITNQVFRDVSSWYHIVLAVDTTQATSSDRLKMYVNGEQITSFSTATYPSLNFSGADWNSNVIHYIGKHSTNYFDGYMADFYNIDGQQLQASDFGQTDSTGIWKPKSYSGSYGTNGFYLKFSNSGSLGADSSGNGNDFTKSGNGRQRTDTPSNVFPTINYLCRTSSSHVLTNTNLTHQVTNNWMYLPANMGASSGKWYAEMKIDAITNNFNCGVMELSGFASDWMNNMNTANTILGANTQGDAWALYGNGANTGTYKNNNTPNYGNISTSFGSNILVGDIISIALDCDNQKIWFGVNGSWDNSGDPAAGTNPMPYNTAMIAGRTYAFASGPEYATQSWNFGNPPYTVSSGNADENGYGNFEYAPPTGFLAMCTKNLASVTTPTINDGSAYFHTQLYTGNGTAVGSGGNVITNDANAGDFKADWLWIKDRTSAYSHNISDSTRGASTRVYSNLTNAEDTNTESVNTFNTDGFTVGNNVGVNTNSNNYVAWQWKANGGTTSSNTDGATTSTVQANTTAGFSVVTYDMGGSNSTFGHGLGKTPACIFFKRRDAIGAWVVYHQSIGVNGILNLNTTDAAATGFNYFPNMTSTIVGVAGSSNMNNDTVAYCFAEIEGYSKFGKYVGNGNANGQVAYTGFRPAFVLIKRTDAAEDWWIQDDKRNVYNPIDKQLYPNGSFAEATEVSTDFLSNGFKLRNSNVNWNASGGSYIYMAFAENPFVTSGGLPVTAR